MRYLLILALALPLAACGNGPTAAVPNVVSLAPQDWYLRYAVDAPVHPVAAPGVLWEFAFPVSGGEVGYVTTPYRATQTIAGKTLSLTFEVVSSNPVYGLWDASTYGAPSLHLFIQRQGDDMSAQGEMQYYRWWCGAGAYTLGSADNQVVTVSCPLTPDAWVSVLGAQNATEFQTALNNLQWAGFTFGASGGWGHGVNVTSGNAKFELLDFSVS